MQISPKSHYAFLNGVSCYQKMQYQTAINYFVQNLSNHAVNPTTKATSHQQSNTFPLTNLFSTLHLPPIEPLSNLSSCLIKTKQYPQAQQVCTYLFKLNPYMSLPYYNMASIYIRQQKYQQAVGMINCAISCEFLRKYERVFEKQALDQAIKYAGNNLSAIKYRIAHNVQYLNFVKKSSNIEYSPSEDIQKAIGQLQKDNQSYSKYKRVYEAKFYEQKQSSNQQFFISTVKPPFILESHTEEDFALNDHKNDIKIKLALMKQLKQRRNLYLELLRINQKEVDLSLIIEEFALENTTKSEYECQEQRLDEQDFSQKSIYQRYDLGNIIDQRCSLNKTTTLETSCELQDSSDTEIPSRCNGMGFSTCYTKHNGNKNVKNNSNNSREQNRTFNSKTTLYSKLFMNNNSKSHHKSLSNTSMTTLNVTKNKQNLRSTQNQKLNSKNYLNKTTLISLRNKSTRLYPTSQLPIPDYKYINEATQEEQLKTSRNKLPTPGKCTNTRKNSCESSCLSICHEKDNLNSSIISILDYDEDSSRFKLEDSSRFKLDKNPHQKSSMIESIVVNPPKERKERENQRHSMNSAEFHLAKNRSHENLFRSEVMPDGSKKMSHSRYNNQGSSLMIDSKSHMKLLSCSKCSVDHSSGQETLPKNVRLNINLTQIYNYPGDLSQLQTFCTITHQTQTYRTELSKGKFPNWKHPLSLHVQNIENISADIKENKTIKIQLWAKSINHKKDAQNLSLYGKHLVGQQTIDLREEKWVKRKIVLENGQKKTAYMYVSMEKIKQSS